MRTYTAIVSAISFAASSAAAGQMVVAAPRAATARAGFMMSTPRAMIGITTSTGTGSRDTLGLLVSTVTRNGPAEKAGIEEGNRIASINGVNLKLASADLGDADMEGLMSRRLMRELDKLKPGDDVDLKVYGNGQTRSMKIKTVDPDSLFPRSNTRRSIEDRPTLGIGIGSSGSKRDTLGVFVMSVEDGGPAAKAGIEEGQRIAAINGVDVRVSHDDAGDDIVSSARVNRFERELSKVKIGESVDLKIFTNGQTKNVKVTPVAWSDIDSHRHSTTIIRDGGMTTIRARPPMDMDVAIDGQMIGERVRAALEKAQAATAGRMEDMGRVFDQMGRSLGTDRVRWFDDNEDNPAPAAVYKLKPEANEVRKLSRTISM